VYTLHILYMISFGAATNTLTMFFTLVHRVANTWAWRSFNRTQRFDIPQDFNCTHNAKNKTSLKCEEATIPNFLVAHAHIHSRHIIYYKSIIFVYLIICILFATVMNFFTIRRRYTVLVVIFSYTFVCIMYIIKLLFFHISQVPFYTKLNGELSIYFVSTQFKQYILIIIL